MTIIVSNIIPRKQVEAAQVGQYTAQGCKTIIDKFTITNTGAANVSFTCNLVASGGNPNAANTVLYNRVVTPGETYTCPELVGQVLEPGGFISTLASLAGYLTLSASGREIT